MRSRVSPRKVPWSPVVIAGALAGYFWTRRNGRGSSGSGEHDDGPGTGKEAYWGEFSSDLAERLLDRARAIGYKAAVREVLPESLQDYLLDEGRSLFWPLVRTDLSKAVVYDLGAGWGALTAGLARTGATVVALEKIPVRAEFLKLRLGQENISNAHVVVGDVNALPFKESSADLVLANGLLEWIGTYSPENSVRNAQLDFLKRCKRTLKPQGSIYIGIENRWSALSLIGEKDHTGIWGTNLLPRPLASFVVNRRTMRFHGKQSNVSGGRDGYRTFTYGLGGYKRLLKAAGLEASFYLPIVSYNRPWIILPGRWGSRRPARRLIANIPASNIQQAGLLKLARLLSYVPLVEYVAPSYSIIAGTSPKNSGKAKVGFDDWAWVADGRRADHYTAGTDRAVSRVSRPLIRRPDVLPAAYGWPGGRRFLRSSRKTKTEPVSFSAGS